MKLIILGIQGSGKGTQSKLIAEKFHLKHISTGDLIRKEIHEKSPEGLKLESLINAGNLAPDELINKIFLKNLPKDNFILDGYPRNLVQVHFLEEVSPPDKAIFIEISDKEVFHRLGLRIQCKNCSEIYGLNKMPKVPGVCDKCSSEIHRRADDSNEGIKRRIELFKQETLPIINFYKSKLVEINGEQPVEQVFQEILLKLEN